MEDKVYIIFEIDLSTSQKRVYSVYANKNKAKQRVDQLVAASIESEETDYTLESFDVVK